MKAAENNYSSYQLDRLVQEIEGRLNDFESGISEKDETIKSFAFFVGECAKNAVNNTLKEVISLIDEKISEYGDSQTSAKLYRKFALIELKQKIEKL